MSKEEKRTVYMIMLAILFYFIIASIPILGFTKDKFRTEMGLLLGCVMAIAMTWHMSYSVTKSLYLEKNHSAFLAFNSVGRLLVVACIIVLAAWTKFVDPIFIVVGMLSLKFGAYVEPQLEKRFCNKK